MPGDEFYLGLLDDLAELHALKSSTYGSLDDPLANFVEVARFSGDPPWRYPLLRAYEKQVRIRELMRQGRVDDLEEELKDCASLFLCAEALRRRTVLGPAVYPLGRPGLVFDHAESV